MSPRAIGLKSFEDSSIKSTRRHYSTNSGLVETLLNFIVLNVTDYTLFHHGYDGLFVTNICVIKGLSCFEFD